MKLNGYTQIGFITGTLIFMLHLFLIKFGLESSGWLGLQYIILLIGIFTTIILYNRENKLVAVDLFLIGIRTMSSAIVVILVGGVVLHFALKSNIPFAQVLMNLILPFALSGAVSSLLSAIIVKTLLQKT